MQPLSQTRLAVELLPAPDPAVDRYQLQHVRCWLARALTNASEVQNPRLRRSITRAILHAATQLGCVVCGKPIRIEELEHFEMERQRSFCHLWGACSDQLAQVLGVAAEAKLIAQACRDFEVCK